GPQSRASTTPRSCDRVSPRSDARSSATACSRARAARLRCGATAHRRVEWDVITDRLVRELAEFDSDGAAVTSCYLDVDGRAKVRGMEVERELERLVRQVAGYIDDEPSVADDVQRMTAHVRDGIDRRGVRGLAMFSCSPRELWKVVNLPVPVHSRITVGHAPAVGQLESV